MNSLKYAKVKNKKELIQKTLEIVRLGSEAILNQKVYSLSGGKQQRVAIARILLKLCDIVLADEPTGNLDEENKKIVLGLFKSLKVLGKIILIVTHDESVSQLCDCIIYL